LSPPTNDPEPYAAAWSRMYRLIVANVVLFLAWAAAGVALVVCPHVPRFYVPLGALGVAGLVAALVANYRLRGWRCPRCNELWLASASGIGGRCQQCKLPWGARS
jgi:membrane protein YdbS with pleckstrin-like domain